MAANKIPSHQTEDVLQEIRTRKAEATSKLGSFMNMVDQGLAVYDGVMMGMRVARNIRRIFGKRR